MSWNFWCNMATQNLIEGWSSLIQLSHFPTVFFYLAEVTSPSHDFTRPPFWIHVRFYLYATPSIFHFVPIGKGILPCYYAAGKIRWLCLLRDCFVEIAGLVWGNKNMSSLLELNFFFFSHDYHILGEGLVAVCFYFTLEFWLLIIWEMQQETWNSISYWPKWQLLFSLSGKPANLLNYGCEWVMVRW